MIDVFFFIFMAACFFAGLYYLLCTKNIVRSRREEFLKSKNTFYANIYGGDVYYVIVKILGVILLVLGSAIAYAMFGHDVTKFFGYRF